MYSSLITSVLNYVSSGLKDSNAPLLLEKVSEAVAERTANIEQQTQLESLEKELENLQSTPDNSFPGSTATSEYGRF